MLTINDSFTRDALLKPFYGEDDERRPSAERKAELEAELAEELAEGPLNGDGLIYYLDEDWDLNRCKKCGRAWGRTWDDDDDRVIFYSRCDHECSVDLAKIKKRYPTTASLRVVNRFDVSLPPSALAPRRSGDSTSGTATNRGFSSTAASMCTSSMTN